MYKLRFDRMNNNLSPVYISYNAAQPNAFMYLPPI